MRAPRSRACCAAWVLVVLTGCGAGTQAPPETGYRRGGVPQLDGTQVAVFPVQLREGGHAELDRELEFALSGAGPAVDWIFPGELRDASERNPGTPLQVSNLPVRGFLAGELQRVGDPLFGNLYRIGAVSGAAYGILPVLARDRVEPDGAVVDIAAAIVDLRSGYVLWYGIVSGSTAPVGSLPGSAQAADALARALFPRAAPSSVDP